MSRRKQSTVKTGGTYAGCQLPTGPLPLAPTIEPPPAAAPEVR